MVALGLVRILRGPDDADRMMAAQLLGTGGIAALLLLGAATGVGAVVDVALTLALLAAFASIAFVKASPPSAADDGDPDRGMRALLNSLSIVAVTAGAFFFLAGTRGAAAFSRHIHAAACADQGRQSRSRTGGARTAAAGRRRVTGFKLVCVWLLVLLSGASRRSSSRARRGGASPTPMMELLNAGLARPDPRAGALGGHSRATHSPRSWASSPTGCCSRWSGCNSHGVDVALTEAAIGGGLTGALLIGAASRLRGTEAAARAERPRALHARRRGRRWPRRSTAALAVCVLTLPDPAPTLAPQAAANIAVTGVGNPITAVLLAFRAMDTLLEAIVLVFALIGVWSLGAGQRLGRASGTAAPRRPNGILAYLARVLPPIGIIVGMYIFWVGADHPGGKFQGATIVAAMWLLVIMAGLADTPPISRTWVRVGLVAGPLVFIAIGLAGAVTAGAFLAYPDGYAKPLIIVIELALMPTLALILALLLAGAPRTAGRSDERRRRCSACAPRCWSASACTASSCNPHPLRKILAFNVVGSGVFLLLGAIARRGAAAGMGGDPVPQALLITGIVVAFSATALAVAVLLRLFAVTGTVTLAADAPAKPEAAARSARCRESARQPVRSRDGCLSAAPRCPRPT